MEQRRIFDLKVKLLRLGDWRVVASVGRAVEFATTVAPIVGEGLPTSAGRTAAQELKGDVLALAVDIRKEKGNSIVTVVAHGNGVIDVSVEPCAD